MEDFLEVRKYAIAALRWWWFIILVSILGGLIGLQISKKQPPIYQATTTLMVGQLTQSSGLTKTDLQTSELLAQTYANIARRQPVLQGVIDTLNLRISEPALQKRVSTEPVEGTQLLEITVEANSPEEAELIADELARQLILQSPSGAQTEEEKEKAGFVNQRLDSLKMRIQDGQRRLTSLETQMMDHVSANHLIQLQDEANTLEDMILGFEDRYTQLLIFSESQQSPNHLAIIEPARVSGRPIRPKPKLQSILAGTIGLLFALGFVFVREYLDNTLKTKEDLSRDLDLTPLGAIPWVKGKDFQDKLLTSWKLYTPWSEAYRMVRSNIQFMSIDKPARSIIVTSALHGEGKSMTVANLGVVMAQTDLKTIIVDADLRRPTQHKIFQVTNSIGVTDLLRATEPDLKDYLKETRIKNLFLLTCGELPSNPSELLGSQRMAQLLTSLSEFADMVIFDSSPIVAFTDAAVLSTKIDGVVLVTLANQTRLEIVRQAVRNLQQVGANLMGGVLNGVASNNEEHYYQSFTSSENLKGHQLANRATKASEFRRWRERLPFFK